MTTGVAELPQVYLKPGGLPVMREPRIVSTVLGSCVAVTFHNARLHVSAIRHGPGRASSGAGKEEGQFQFVSDAMPDMAMQFAGRGLGSRNVQAVRELLEDASFPIRASNVGGDRGRKILSNTSTGDVRDKHLPAGSTKVLP